MNIFLRLFWPLFILTTLHFLYLEFFVLSAIRAESGGFVALDLKVMGYSFFDTYAFFSGNAATGGTSFAEFHATHDMIFPALYGATLSLAMWGLNFGWSKTVRIILSIAPLAAAVVDYFENAKLIAMINMDPRDITALQVAKASALTETKFILIGISFGIIVVILARNFMGSAPQSNWR